MWIITDNIGREQAMISILRTPTVSWLGKLKSCVCVLYKSSLKCLSKLKVQSGISRHETFCYPFLTILMLLLLICYHPVAGWQIHSHATSLITECLYSWTWYDKLLWGYYCSINISTQWTMQSWPKDLTSIKNIKSPQPPFCPTPSTWGNIY